MEEQFTAKNVVLKRLRKPLGTSLRLASAAMKRLAHWQQARRNRAELTLLSDDCLRDIGLSRADVQQASGRPFLEDPLRR